MIACYDLTVRRPGGEGVLFDGVDFEIEEGDWAEFVGGPGTGKTVLFSILGGRAKPVDGRLIVAGRNVDRLDAEGWARTRRQIGQCAQAPEFLEERSVMENLLVPSVARGEADGARGRAQSWLEAAGAERLSSRPVGRLAAHERRLVGALRAAVGLPKLMLFDGTFDADAPWRRAVLARLARARQTGRTVVVFGRATTVEPPADARVFRLAGDASISRDTVTDEA